MTASGFSSNDLPESLRHDVYPFIDPQGRLQGAAKGLNVLVTGASRGCGRSMAIAFAQAGASRLFLVGRDEKSLATTAELTRKAGTDCKAATYTVDMSRADVVSSFKQIAQVSYFPHKKFLLW